MMKKMTIRLKMKNYNMILTEKQQKYQIYHHVKWINMNILQVKKYYLGDIPKVCSLKIPEF